MSAKGRTLLLDDDALDAGAVVYHHQAGGKLLAQLFAEVARLGLAQVAVLYLQHRQAVLRRRHVAMTEHLGAPRVDKRYFPLSFVVGPDQFVQYILFAPEGLFGVGKRVEQLALTGLQYLPELIIIIGKCQHRFCRLFSDKYTISLIFLQTMDV